MKKANYKFLFLFFIITFKFNPVLALATKPAEPKPQVIIQEVKPVADAKKLLYPAQVQAKINSTVTADLEGHIKKVLKNIGAPVKAGEVVLYLENQDPAFTYASIPVRAPVSGVLSQLSVQPMSKVSKGEKLFSVINTEKLKVNVEVPSSEISKLAVGQLGTFFANPQDEAGTKVQVVGVSPIIDPRSGTATAEIEFLTNEPTYKTIAPRIGIVGQVSFEIISGEVMLLPENALSYVGGKPTVRVIDAQFKNQRREVVLGEQRESLFVIKSGLKNGEKVIVRANRTPKDNEVVEVKSADEKDKK
ncbi:MAG: HlyD family efflux transporter periplasmic adaptor subunit [Bdellovibrionaceae bacterium]|nr:HlyD family efflux transporter periplasmic adaptor subunit [Bdellovibrio sp.]